MRVFWDRAQAGEERAFATRNWIRAFCFIPLLGDFSALSGSDSEDLDLREES